MTNLLPPLEKNAMPQGALLDQFNDLSVGHDVLVRARNLADYAMINQPDKGSGSLRDHCHAVAFKVFELYHGRVPHERLSRLQAAAELHDLLEIKKDSQTRLWTQGDMIRAGIPLSVVSTTTLLTRKFGQGYLDNIHEIAHDADATLVKIADLSVNMSWGRGFVWSRKQSFLHKKHFLYPSAKLYLEAVATGRVDPEKTSPIAFIMQDESVPARLKNIGILLKYSSDQSTYDRRRALPGVNMVRRIGARFAQPAPLSI